MHRKLYGSPVFGQKTNLTTSAIDCLLQLTNSIIVECSESLDQVALIAWSGNRLVLQFIAGDAAAIENSLDTSRNLVADSAKAGTPPRPR